MSIHRLPSLRYAVLLLGLSLPLEARSQPVSAASENASVLPASLRAALAREGCTLPAAPSDLARDSGAVIPYVAYRAAVLIDNTREWVLACDRAAPTPARLILVYPAAITATSRPLARFRLSGWRPGDEPGCEELIGIASPDWVQAGLEATGRDGSQLVRLRPSERRRTTHDGIFEGRCEGDEGSRIHYWTGERWVTLPVLVREPARGAI